MPVFKLSNFCYNSRKEKCPGESEIVRRGDVLHALLRGVLFKTFTVRKNEFNGLLLLMFT